MRFETCRRRQKLKKLNYTSSINLKNAFGWFMLHSLNYTDVHSLIDRCGTVVKVLCYKSEGRWFDPSWCQWIFH